MTAWWSPSSLLHSPSMAMSMAMAAASSCDCSVPNSSSRQSSLTVIMVLWWIIVGFASSVSSAAKVTSAMVWCRAAGCLEEISGPSSRSTIDL